MTGEFGELTTLHVRRQGAIQSQGSQRVPPTLLHACKGGGVHLALVLAGNGWWNAGVRWRHRVWPSR